jgi:hypothetical protein
MTSFKLTQVQFSYEADFSPPILEIASSNEQVPFMKSYGHKIQLDLAIFSGLLSDRTT